MEIDSAVDHGSYLGEQDSPKIAEQGGSKIEELGCSQIEYRGCRLFTYAWVGEPLTAEDAVWDQTRCDRTVLLVL